MNLFENIYPETMKSNTDFDSLNTAAFLVQNNTARISGLHSENPLERFFNNLNGKNSLQKKQIETDQCNINNVFLNMHQNQNIENLRTNNQIEQLNAKYNNLENKLTACLVCLKATTNTLPEESKKAILPFINCLDQTLLNERHHQEEILSSYSGPSYQTDINKMPELSPAFANNAIPVPWSKPQEKKRGFWNSFIEAAEEIAMKKMAIPLVDNFNCL